MGGTMHCVEIKTKLCAYLDHELEPEISRRIEKHIAKCAGCKQFLKTLQMVDGRIRDVALLSAPDSLCARIMFRVGKPGAAQRHGRVVHRAVNWATEFYEALFELIKASKWPSTQTLDEFADFPPGSFSRVYFKLIE